MNTDIFKSYDIRGVVDTQLDEDTMQRIGFAFATHNNLSECLVGMDVRESSPAFQQAFITGLRKAGCSAVTVGVCSTAQLKWAVAEYKHEAAAMITASHNPPEYNGLKLYREHGSPYGKAQGLHELLEYADTTLPEVNEDTTVTQKDTQTPYVTFLHAHLQADDTHVFVDPSAGAACRELTALLEKGAYPWTLYNAQEDAQFSEHSPNPLEKKAYETAAEYSSINNCISVVLDGDADRLLLIDENGKPVPPDFLAAYLAQTHLHTGAVSTVNASRALKDYCKQQNKQFRQTAVGWVFVQNALTEINADIGAEKSGHIFFKDAHNAEAPLLCLLLTLKQLRADNTTLADAIAPFKEEYHSSIEHNYHVADRQAVLNKAKQVFADYGEVDETDGVLIESEHAWISFRQSNTEPVIRVTWEATSNERYQELQEEILAFMSDFSAK